MSKSLNHELRSWKDLESQIRGTVVFRKGIPLSKRDSATYCDALILHSLMMTDLLSSSSPSRHSRIVRWLKQSTTWDVLQVSDLFKVILTFVRKYKGGSSYVDFKHQLSQNYPFAGDFLSPIKEEVEEYLSSPSAATFTIINQFASFMTRITLRDLDLETEALEKYHSTEQRLADSTYHAPTLRILNRIMREWFSEFREEELIPSHGNGSVADIPSRPSLLDKYQSLATDTRLEYWTAPFGGAQSFFPRVVSKELDRTCRVQCVPKSISTKRVISMEPVVLQYFQHAVFREIDDYICDHRELRRRIHIHDSSVNTELSQIGSQAGSYATIDLSDASDSVSWVLVKAIFAKTPILRALTCTKSDFALLPDGSKVVLQKFAPMGSALCFPIECLIFACICEYALRFSGIHLKGNQIPYVVYGDDIVIMTELADEVIRLLHLCNFIVNTDKTFTDPQVHFRESCGGEYFDGVDVSPVRLSRKFSNDRPGTSHPELYPHYVKMANNLLSYDMRLTRLWFVHNLLCLPRHQLPLFGIGESMVNTPSPSNFHAIHKYNKNWQADMILCGDCISTFASSSQEDEDIRLFEYLRVTCRRTRDLIGPDDIVQVQLSRPRLLLKSRFVSNS